MTIPNMTRFPKEYFGHLGITDFRHNHRSHGVAIRIESTLAGHGITTPGSHDFHATGPGGPTILWQSLV